jgi:Fe-S-cluster containining protein
VKFPAIALKTYQSLKSNPLFLGITDYILRVLRFERSAIKRAKLAHTIIDDLNSEVVNHPLILEHSGCKAGCADCCHTEVSVTPDEAELLAERVMDGVDIDWNKLRIQAEQIERSQNYYDLDFSVRGCIFLSENRTCRVYDDRPSVCRTNMVIGNSAQCSTADGITKEMRLVKTEKADMAIIGQFMMTPTDNNLLPKLLLDKLNRIINQNQRSKRTLSKTREM